nr:transposase (putative), gypsy type [Tanacetum cinerariifolium]
MPTKIELTLEQSQQRVSYDVLELNLNRTLIRRYPKEFLSIVGLSRSFVDLDVRPTFLDMGLLDFVKSIDLFKVKVKERTLAEGEVPLLTETVDMVVALSNQTVHLVSHTIVDEIREHSGKNKRNVNFSTIPPPVKKARMHDVVITEPVGSMSVASHAEEFDSSSVTPTLDRRNHEDSSLTMDGNVQTCRASELMSFLPLAEVENVTAKPIDGAGAKDIYVPHWNVTNDAALDDLVMYRTLIDHVPPPGYWSYLRNHHDTKFLDLLNMKSAQQSSEVVQQKDTKIVTLRGKLEKAKSEAAKVSELRKRGSELEVVAVAKAKEVAGPIVQTIDLSRKVSRLDSVRDELKSQVSKLEVYCEGLRMKVMGEARMREEFASMQDVEAQRFDERSAKMDARIVGFLLMSYEYLYG